MNIVERSAKILGYPVNIEGLLEVAIRNCYQSESNGQLPSKLINKVVNDYKHESVLEHVNITVEIVCDRATMSQITRHRLASYSIESQRYCNYSKDKFNNGIKVILPYEIKEGTIAYDVWQYTTKRTEKAYLTLIKENIKPEIARSILPNCAATTIVMTMNLRSWRNFFKLRLAKDAQADIRDIASKIYKAMLEVKIPEYLIRS